MVVNLLQCARGSDSKQLPAAHRARQATRRAVRAAVWAILLSLPHTAWGQADDRAAVGEYQVKAAFLYHFTKFIEWPPAAATDNVVVIGVLGADPFGPALDFLFGDKTLRGKPFEVRRVANTAEARRCHLLFLSIPDKKEMHRALAALAGSPVVTVGDSEDFFTGGGIIYLFVEESKIRFDVNLAAARGSQLAISAALLRLARNVEGK